MRAIAVLVLLSGCATVEYVPLSIRDMRIGYVKEVDGDPVEIILAPWVQKKINIEISNGSR